MPEILAPVSSQKHLKAAVNAGANAVYFGVENYNARAFANNFTLENAQKAIAFAHENGVLVYITMNILLSDREMQKALDLTVSLHNMGADAFIIQDEGFAALLNINYPEIRLHASTQMSVLNADSVLRLEKIGFKRVVLGRELSFLDIEQIKKKTNIELEVFVHGSLCMSVSGQCYFSSVLGQRSGNRGKCAQPCRLAYRINNKYAYPLSLKDLYTGAGVDKLSKIGVRSFKIEGRMKRPEYVYEAVRAYVKHDFSDKTQKRLDELFSRGGFTDGYLNDKLGRSMFGIRSNTQKEQAAITVKKTDINKIIIKRKELKQNKREILESVTLPDLSNRSMNKSPDLWLAFNKFAQIPKDIDKYKAKKIFIDFQEAKLNSKRMDYNKHGVYLPFFIRESKTDEFYKTLKSMADSGLRYVMCSNTGQVLRAQELGLEVLTDYRFNIFNSYSLQKISNDNVAAAVLSFETNFGQINDLHRSVSFGILAYGYLPLMIFRNCIIQSFNSNGNCEKACTSSFKITDRKNIKFDIAKGYDCSNILYNSRPLYTPDMKNIQRIGLDFFLLQFTLEDKAETERIVSDFIAKRTNTHEYTRGLYNKGLG